MKTTILTTLFAAVLVGMAVLVVAGCAPELAEAPQAVPSEGMAVPAADESAGEPVPEAIAEGAEDSEETEKVIQDAVAAEHKVELRASGFTPRTLRISSGETVTFVNMESKKRQIASNMHPVHASYPGSNTNKCGTAEESTIFDACHGRAEGEEFSFTFSKKGIWGYHDHLQPSMGGTIVVE